MIHIPPPTPPWRVDELGADEWRLTNIHSGRVLEGVRVVRKRGRFRFEATA